MEILIHLPKEMVVCERLDNRISEGMLNYQTAIKADIEICNNNNIEQYSEWKPASTLPTKQWICNNCDGLIELPVYANDCYYKYCPNCGVGMRGV